MNFLQVSFTRRGAIGLLLIRIAAILLFSQFVSAQSAAPQQTKRTFENKIPEHVPLKVKIKKEKEEKALDLNNKNWFRDIEIEVTNTSDKPIYFLSMDVIMPDVLDERGIRVTFPLTYGRGDFYDHDAKPLPEDIPIEPKATHVFTFEETWKRGYEAWRNRNHKGDPTKLELWISHLSFGDGTGFTSMSAVPFPIKRDPEDVGACFEKPRPPDQWSRTPNIFSALFAKSFRRPADLLPVELFLASLDDPNEVVDAAMSPDICCPETSCNKFKFTHYDCVCDINVQTPCEYDKRTNGGNADGQLDNRDAVFSGLRLWQDRNHNGLSESNELHPLPALNVATIELDYKPSKKTDMNGNQFSYRAKVKNLQGQQSGRWAWDVYLVRSQ